MIKKYTSGVIKTAKDLRIIDDTLFRLIAERKDVCQEILRTLLGDDGLVVHKSTPQYDFSGFHFHRAITVDCLCELSDGTLCNIEMQKGNINDDIRRCRFHASTITTSKTPTNTAFKDIPDVKILYITEYDALKNGQVVTLVKRCQNTNGEFAPVDDGEEIYFANTAVKDNSEGSKLLQLFLKREAFHEAAFPALSNAIDYFKNQKEGQDAVCKAVEDYAKKYAKEYGTECCIGLLVSLVNDGAITPECAAEKAGMSLEEFNKYLDR